MESNKIPPTSDYDEIDLFELVENLWAQKILIILCAVSATLIGYVYTMIAPEKWTAEIQISAPSSVQIDSLNPPELAVFKQQSSLDENSTDQSNSTSLEVLNDVAPKVVPNYLLATFLTELRSVRALLRFESNQPVSIFQSGRELTDEERIDAAKGFLENNLKVTPPSKTSTYTTIELTMDSPIEAASILREYLGFVSSEVIEKRGADLRLAISRAIQTNEFEIERARKAYLRRLEEDLALLEEALRIAKSAGIRDNQSGLFVDRTDNRLTKSSGLYLRGERLLKAELQALKARIDSASLIPEVRNLQAENELLPGITIDTADASAFEIQKPATPPSGRDSPKTKLVLALSLVLGGMIGVLTALIRSAIRNRKARLSVN